MSWVAVAAAAVAGVAAIKQDQAQESQALTDKNFAEYNAKLAEQKVEIANSQTNQNEETQRRRINRALGAQRAAANETGAGLSGSTLDVYRQSATDAELDALNIRYQGNLEAQGYSQQADLEKYQAKSADKRAKGISKNSATHAITAGVSGYFGGGGKL